MIRFGKCIFSWLALLFTFSQANAASIPIYTVQEFSESIKNSKASLKICGNINLQGGFYKLADRITLDLSSGSLNNGVVTGANTNIEKSCNKCFGCDLEGSWILGSIEDTIFNREFLTDDKVISNINTLQSDVFKNIIILVENYRIAINPETYSGLILSSNTILKMSGTLSIVPNNLAKYNIINVTGKHDVTIEGGTIIGDVGKHTYLEGSTNEWGMGISVVASDRVSISDTRISLCTGDGLYLGGNKELDYNHFDNASNNVAISNVVCDKNRRQGISLVHAYNISIKNSTFSNTGQVEFINPGHGIDIEPNISNGRFMAVHNIVIENCKFFNNKGTDLSTAHYVNDENGKSIRQIKLKTCELSNGITIRSGSFDIDNCIVPKINVYVAAKDLEDITVINSTITGGLYLHSSVQTYEHPEYTGILNKLIVRKCSFSSAKENKSNSVIAVFGDLSRIKKILFMSCKFKYGKAYANKKLSNKDLDSKFFIRCEFQKS